jgi:PAP2 superfamily
MFRISRLGWIWVGRSAVLAVIEYLRSEIAIVADGALFSMGLIWCVILLGMILSMRHSPLRAFALPLECLAKMIAVSVICSFLQYPAAKIARPLIDAELAAIDRALYFDWPAYFAWVLRHPLALNLLSGVYLSLGVQSALMFLAWRPPDRVSIWLSASSAEFTCRLACKTLSCFWRGARQIG